MKNNHPLLRFRPRRLAIGIWDLEVHYPYTGRRFLRDFLIRERNSVIKIFCSGERLATGDRLNPANHELNRVTATQISTKGRSSSMDPAILNVIMSNLSIHMLSHPGKIPFQVIWNLQTDVLEVKYGDHGCIVSNVQYPDPCYTTGEITFACGTKFDQHIDTDLPKDLLCECEKIISLIRDYKQYIADLCVERTNNLSADSLQKIVQHVDATTPLAWRDGDKILAVWHPAQPSIGNICPDKAILYQSHRTADASRLSSKRSYPDTKPHPHGNALVAETSDVIWHRANQDGYPEFDFDARSYQGLGSERHAKLTASRILKQDWPIPNLDGIPEEDLKGSMLNEYSNIQSHEKFFQDIWESSTTKDFCQELQEATQALVQAVIPDKEVLQAVLPKRDAEHHLYCNFVAKHPHIREHAIKYPGIVYAAMISYLRNMPHEKIVQTYDCVHFSKDWEFYLGWQLISTANKCETMEYFMPARKLAEYIRNPHATTQDLLDILYDQETQQRFPKSQLLALMQRIPILYVNPEQAVDLSEEAKNVPTGHSGAARPVYSPFYDILFPEDSVKEGLLTLPVQDMPITEEEWRILQTHCIETEHRPLPLFPGNILEYFQKKSDYQKSRSASRRVIQNQLMRGIWGSTIRSFRKAQNPEDMKKVIGTTAMHLHEIHDILDNLQDVVQELIEVLPKRKTERILELQCECLKDFAKRSKTQQEACIQRWNRDSSYLAELEHHATATLNLPEEVLQKLNPCWPKLMHETLTQGEYSAHEINTTNQLRIHGNKMRHCVGGYTENCLGVGRVWSGGLCAPLHIVEFLDGKNKPIATGSYQEPTENCDYSEIILDQFLGHSNREIWEEDLNLLNLACLEQMRKNYRKLLPPEETKMLETRETIYTDFCHAKARAQEHGINDAAHRTSAYWKWRILQGILPNLGDLPKDPKFQEPPLPEWALQ